MRIVISAVLAAGAAGLVEPAYGSFHTYDIVEVYSNSSGSVQFIEMLEADGFNGQHLFSGQQFTTNLYDGSPNPAYVFGSNLPSSSTANTNLLLATQGFADLGTVTPDFIIPAGFITPAADTLSLVTADVLAISNLPTSGEFSINRSGASQVPTPTNFAGQTGAVPEPGALALLGLGAVSLVRRR